jgi:nucleotide-binding universal stress UspA family protein
MTSPAREVTEVRPDGGIVVGDDGSQCAAAAVREATAVRPADVPPGIVPSLLEFEAATLAAERKRVESLVKGRVPVEVHAVHANAAKALICASETAELLVVGTRGLGGFRSLLLGSVAEQCIRHAATSVLVVRG